MPQRQPKPYHVMAKPTGSDCNLSCRYCFFLEKAKLYPGEFTRMDDEVLRAYASQYIESQQASQVTIAWQGGEPTLMGLDFFRRSVEIAEECRPPDKRVAHTIQTNGTLIDEEWCEFFRENRFLVGLSIDGPREMHDAYRVDGRGNPTFEKVMRAARLLREHEVDFNILCSVHAANENHPMEVYRFFRDELEVEWIQFIPIVERINDDGTTLLQQGDRVTERTVDPVKWGGFLTTIFWEWVHHDVGRVHVNFFESAFASRVGAPAMMCVFNETCGDALALEYNGDLYSCDHFVEPGYLLGNILEEPLPRLATSERQQLFGESKRDSLPRFCRECEFLYACGGGCPKNRFRPTPDGEPGLNYLCEGYREFFRQTDAPMKMMARLYRADRPPAMIMDFLAASEKELRERFASAGPDDPCPCGSGKKFKDCHG